MELLLYLALSANAVSVAFAMNHSSNLSNLTTSFESTRPSALKVTPNITASNITSSKYFFSLCILFKRLIGSLATCNSYFPDSSDHYVKFNKSLLYPRWALFRTEFKLLRIPANAPKATSSELHVSHLLWLL